MTVFLSSTETENEVVLQWHSTAPGDFVDNRNGVGVEHPTIVTAGRASLTISGQPPEEFEAPHVIILPTNTSYTFTTIDPGTIHCVYSKLSGAADEVRHLVADETVVFN